MDQSTNNLRITRAQTLRAMQTLIVTMGGAKGYGEWLAAMPEGTGLSPSGGVDQTSIMAIAENNDAYNAAVLAFKDIMTPVMSSL